MEAMRRRLGRRGFMKAAVGGAGALALGAAAAGAARESPAGVARPKLRVGKIYVGHQHPGWPMSTVDLNAEMRRFEAELAKLSHTLADVEFVGGDLVSAPEEFEAARKKLQGVDGVLVLQLTMGIGGYLQSLCDLKVPVVLFTMPYAGHEWHTIASLQRQGKMVDAYPSSDFADIARAIRPIRAFRRLQQAKILYLMEGGPDPEYCRAVKEKFGTEIKNLPLEDVLKAYEAASEEEVSADAERWLREATKIVEPTREEILKSSRLYLAMRKVMEDEQADAITINCLGMFGRGLPAYPCLGFVRLTSEGLAGICEADLKSTMTHLIFYYLVGKPGFITDPMIDFSNDTIIHAHCVAPIHMDGQDGPQAPYDIRSHLEDGKGVSLRVQMRPGQEITMARLIGTDKLLFSTGTIVDSPDVDRGCRSKIAVKVGDAQKFLDGWSCGLHRVVFYGNHTRDVKRLARFLGLSILNEETDDLHGVQGLEWEPYVHA